MVRVRATGTAAHAARPEGGLSAIHRLATALLEAGVLTGQSERAMRGVAALSGDIYGERAGIACEDEDTGRSTMVCGMARMEKWQALPERGLPPLHRHERRGRQRNLAGLRRGPRL